MNSFKLSRRTYLKSAVAAGISLTTINAFGSESDVPVNDDGLFHQNWFLESFLDLSEDLSSAADNGKHLVILFEQKGCPYCRELHRVNFANEKIVEFAKKNFDFLQLNLWGSRKVTDFDGTEMEERHLAQKWKVVFTPTIIFFPTDINKVKGKSGHQVEVARMPGYMKPFHFISMLEYVEGEHYNSQIFQRFLQDKFKRLQSEGKTPSVW